MLKVALSDVIELVEFCQWILENVDLCDKRCLMSSFDDEQQECTRKTCPDMKLQMLLEPFKIEE